SVFQAVGAGEGDLQQQRPARQLRTAPILLEPALELDLPTVGQRKDMPVVTALLGAVDAHDQAFPGHPFERLIQVARIDRPRRTQALLQTFTELIAVSRPLAQQSQQCVPCRHPASRSDTTNPSAIPIDGNIPRGEPYT